MVLPQAVYKQCETHSGILMDRTQLWLIEAAGVPVKFSNHSMVTINQNFQSTEKELLIFWQGLFLCPTQVLQQAFWNQTEWVEFMSAVQQLAQSLASSADHLVEKRIKMQADHGAEEVVKKHWRLFECTFHRCPSVSSPLHCTNQ